MTGPDCSCVSTFRLLGTTSTQAGPSFDIPPAQIQPRPDPAPTMSSPPILHRPARIGSEYRDLYPKPTVQIASQGKYQVRAALACLPRPRQVALMTRPWPSQCVAARSAMRREASQPPWRCCPARGEMRFQLLDWAGQPILQYVKHDGAGRPTACAWTSAPCAFRRSDPSPSAVDKRHRDDV